MRSSKPDPHPLQEAFKEVVDFILPCPCCGGDPELTFIGNAYTKSRKVTIKCRECKLKRTDSTIKNDSVWCAKVAIKQWNNRL